MHHSDIRLAGRALGRSPGFALIAAASIALGIAAVSVIFALIDALLLRPLASPEAGRLVRVGLTTHGQGFAPVSYPDFVELREAVPAFDGLLGHAPNDVVLTVGAEPRSASMEIVTGNYFDVLGVRPSPGRGFVAEEDATPSTHPVIVISHELWRGAFGSDAGIVGRAVRVNGHPFTVVGVAPAGFGGTFPGFRVDLWAPVMMKAEVLPSAGGLADRDARFLMLIGRLASGSTRAQAQARLDALAPRLASADGIESAEPGFRLASAAGVHPSVAGLVRAFLALLMGMVVIVLLIACVNVAGLMLVRVSARARERAIRSALGASRWRVARLFIVEGLILAVAGGLAGGLLAMWATRLLTLWRPEVGIPLGLDIRVSGRVLSFAALATMGSALLFSAGPALRASERHGLAGLRGPDDAGRLRARGVLVIAQIAMSVLLLFGAGLLQRSLRVTRGVDPGFDESGITLLRASPELLGYDEARARAMWSAVRDRAARLPGVRQAALGLFVPLGDRSDRMPATAVEVTPDAAREADFVDYTYISDGWLGMLGIGLLDGRDFGPVDVAGSEPVAIVSQALAERLWPGERSVGRRLRIDDRTGLPREVTVVGMVPSIRYRSLGEPPHPLLYLPWSQWYRPDMTLYVEGDVTAASLGALLAGIEPDLPAEVRTMSEKTSFSLIPLRLAGGVLTGAGAIGVFLAATGIFGIVAYSVSRRRRELAIRMALGARATGIRWMVVNEALRMAGVGLAIGLGAAILATRLLRGLLIGVGAADPIAIGLVLLVFAGVTVWASYAPAKRASALDPALVLRED